MARKKSAAEVYEVRVKGYGPIPIKIYSKARGKYWLVEDLTKGKRRLLNCRSREAAHQRAELIADAVAKGKQALLDMTRQDAAEYEIARRSVQPFGASILSACHEWAQAEALLAGKASVLDAVRFYLERNGGGISPKTFNEVKAAFMELKAQQKISDHEQRRISSRLDRFAVRFGERMLDSITPGEFEQFLTGLNLAPKTFRHYRKSLAALYNFARVNRYVPKDCEPAREFRAPQEGSRNVEFCNPEHVKKLLAAAPTAADVLYVVLCAFAGLRPCETVRIQWEMIGQDHMRLPYGIAGKRRPARNVPILPNLKLWLAPYRKASGPVLPPDFNIRLKPSELGKLAGVRWIDDGLRHGYGTHRYATVRNIEQVADELGNSIGVCKKHYVNKLVTEEEGKTWFAIQPDTNVIPMPTEAPTEAAIAAR